MKTEQEKNLNSLGFYLESVNEDVLDFLNEFSLDGNQLLRIMKDVKNTDVVFPVEIVFINYVPKSVFELCLRDRSSDKIDIQLKFYFSNSILIVKTVTDGIEDSNSEQVLKYEFRGEFVLMARFYKSRQKVKKIEEGKITQVPQSQFQKEKVFWTKMDTFESEGTWRPDKAIFYETDIGQKTVEFDKTVDEEDIQAIYNEMLMADNETCMFYMVAYAVLSLI